MIPFDNGVLTIDLAMLDPDTYTLTLIVGQNTKELKFTIFASLTNL